MSDNSQIAKRDVDQFREQLVSQAGGLTEYYYLKGGNAISLLKGSGMMGDYDFRLVPVKNVYAHWANRIGEIDNLVLSALQAAADVLYSGNGEAAGDEGGIVQSQMYGWNRICCSEEGQGTNYFRQSA